MVAALLLLIGGGVVSVLPRHRRVAAWRVLRPAEAALRRLIVIVERVSGIEVLPAVRSADRRFPAGVARGAGSRIPAFALFDPRKRFDSNGSRVRGTPNIRFFDGYDAPVPAKSVATPDDMVSAERLCRRLQALQRALGDLPKQARRLARWQAKREVVRAVSGKYIAPIRPGKPPGNRDRGKHPVDEILRECHKLALYLVHDPP